MTSVNKGVKRNQYLPPSCPLPLSSPNSPLVTLLLFRFMLIPPCTCFVFAFFPWLLCVVPCWNSWSAFSWFFIFLSGICLKTGFWIYDAIFGLKWYEQQPDVFVNGADVQYRNVNSSFMAWLSSAHWFCVQFKIGLNIITQTQKMERKGRERGQRECWRMEGGRGSLLF